MLTLLVALALTAEPAVCRVDADCAIVVNCGCGCCRNGPQAVPKTEAQRIEQHCATVGPCAPNSGCDIVCEPPASPEGFRAVCKASQCLMAQKGKAAKPSKK
jgi:hypothetical protein